MPEDRLFHPRLMGSKKVTSLTALERVVWMDMILVADDWGVLIDRPAALRGADRFLAAMPERDVAEAMKNVVTTGLFVRFEHQDEGFLLDPTWQTFQKVRYPRRTYLPIPPAEILLRCTDETVRHFANSHTNRQQYTDFGKVLESFPKDSRNILQGAADPGATDARLTATGSRLQAKGSSEEEDNWPDPGALAELWNKMAPDQLPRVTAISNARRNRYAIYLRQFPDRRWWQEVFTEYQRSDFLLGRRNGPDHEGFKADLDWLCTKGKADGVENCVKVHEGKYRNDQTSVRATLSPKTRGNVATLEQFTAREKERESAGLAGPNRLRG